MQAKRGRDNRFYKRVPWLRLRRLQLTHEPLCRVCAARGVDRLATEVDHIEAIEAGGAPLDQANLQSLCHECHSRKTASDAGMNVRHGCDTSGVPMDFNHRWRSGVKDRHSDKMQPDAAGTHTASAG